MNWPWQDEPPRAWSPPESQWVSLLAIPVSPRMRILDQFNHLTLLADRVQWMLNQSEMDLSYFLSILDEAGVHPAWACQGIDLDNARQGSS